MPTYVHFTLKSANVKTGAMPVSTSSAKTCPPTCALFKSGACYAKQGPLALHWAKVSAGERGMPWQEFCDAVSTFAAGTVWRHNQAGDLPGVGARIHAGELRALVKANEGKKGFTYTHKHVAPENLPLIKEANANGFTVNLSADSLADADRLHALQVGPVAVVLRSDQLENLKTPGGRKIVICPKANHPELTCAECKLCTHATRQAIVGFPAHGSKKRALSESLA